MYVGLSVCVMCVLENRESKHYLSQNTVRSWISPHPILLHLLLSFLLVPPPMEVPVKSLWEFEDLISSPADS